LPYDFLEGDVQIVTNYITDDLDCQQQKNLPPLGNAIDQAKEQLREIHRNILQTEDKLKNAREQANKLIDLALSDTVPQRKTYKERLNKLEVNSPHPEGWGFCANDNGLVDAFFQGETSP